MKSRRNQIQPSRLAAQIAIACMIALFHPSVVSAQVEYDGIQWQSDVETAKKIAIAENKLVLLHFGASWCRPCKTLETYVFKAKRVQNAIAENVVPVKLDADRAVGLVNEYDVQMVPFDIVITPNGRIISERRSPADADNYARMISSTANASRTLGKENLGPIAYRGEFAKNPLTTPGNFRPEAPSHDEFGLSKDGSLLQRRQSAFSGVDGGGAKTQTNPWVKKKEIEDDVVATNASVSDLERNRFLAKDRDWYPESNRTQRAQPKRIVNNRYFESVAEAKRSDELLMVSDAESESSNSAMKANPFVLASSQKDVSEFEGAMVIESSSEISSDFDVAPRGDNSIPELSIDETAETESQFGDFNIDTNANATANEIIVEDVTESKRDTVEDLVNGKVKFCLKGKCPVTLITEGRWVDGDPAFGIVHRNRTYIFADAAKLKMFRSDADGFSPVLAGYDPVIYHEQGKLVDGNVENGVFMGSAPRQQVILFENAETRGKFQTSPQKYLDTIREATKRVSGSSTMR